MRRELKNFLHALHQPPFFALLHTRNRPRDTEPRPLPQFRRGAFEWHAFGVRAMRVTVGLLSGTGYLTYAISHSAGDQEGHF
jgi:hypothetical protein